MELVKGGNTILMDLVYDGTGARAKKIVSGASTSTTYYIGEHYEIKDGTATKFIFAGNMRIAMVTATGTLYFHKDHLGSSTVITDANGVEVEATAYMPFGTTRSHTGTDTTNYKFTDQELDPESGLYNYGARLYDPVIGRFISADSIVPDFSSPQALNRYAYCLNNPLIFVDPTGYFSLTKLFKAAVSGFVGGVAFVLSGGNPIIAGMAAGATSGALSGGGVEAVFIGAVTGGALGGVGGLVYDTWGAAGAYAMLGGGAVASYGAEGIDGLLYFAGGLAGGIAGAVIASDLTTPTISLGQSINDDPLDYNGTQLTATDAKANMMGSWPATSGKPGSTTSLADQMAPNFGPIPAGKYSVNPNNIQRWADLPWYQKVAAYLPGKHGELPGGVVAWGHTRVPIDIPGGSVVFNTPTGVYSRGNFFIHGGWYPGSAGCIDLGAYEASFFNYFSGQTESMSLTVHYGN